MMAPVTTVGNPSSVARTPSSVLCRPEPSMSTPMPRSSGQVAAIARVGSMAARNTVPRPESLSTNFPLRHSLRSIARRGRPKAGRILSLLGACASVADAVEVAVAVANPRPQR